MAQQFNVRLAYGKPSNLLVFIGAILVSVVIVPKAVSSLGIDWSLGISFVWVALVFVGLWWYLKRQVKSFIVLVDTTHFIARQGTSIITTVPFAEVIKYRYMVTKGVHWLIFTMKDGIKIKICGNSNYGEIGDFSAMVRAVELVAKMYQDQNPNMMVRYKGFF